MSILVEVSLEREGKTESKKLTFNDNQPYDQLVLIICCNFNVSRQEQKLLKLYYIDNNGTENNYDSSKTAEEQHITNTSKLVARIVQERADSTKQVVSKNRKVGLLRLASLEIPQLPSIVPLQKSISIQIPFDLQPNQSVQENVQNYLKNNIDQSYFLEIDDFIEEDELPNDNPNVSIKIMQDTETSQKYIFKENTILHKDEAKEFVREVQLLALLHHPCVQRIHGVILPNGPDDPFIMITPYFKNRDLFKLFNKPKLRKKLTPTRKHIIMYGIAQGMRYLHMYNIVHRDIKPQNILITDNIEPVITDFGLSKQTISDESGDGESLKQTIAEKGTLKYMPPEVINPEMKNGNSIYDAKAADVFSFAMLCYFLYSGKEPFYGLKRVNDIRMKIINGERPLITEQMCPEHVKDFIEQCWVECPENRPTFEEIVSYLENKDFLNQYSDFDREVFDAYRQKVEIQKEDQNNLISINNTQTAEESNAEVSAVARISTRSSVGPQTSTGNKSSFPKPLGETDIDITHDEDDDNTDFSDDEQEENVDNFDFSDVEQEENVDELREQADQGDKDSQYAYACLLRDGKNGVSKDLNQAYHYFNLAAEQKQSNAIVQRAICLQHGQGVQRNEKESFDILIDAATNDNNSEAQYILSKLYKHQQPPNFIEMLKWLRIASNNQHGDACFDLATYLEKKRLGTRSSPKEIADLYQASFELGSARGILYMANCYYRGTEFCPRNLNRSYELFNIAAKTKNQESVLSIIEVFRTRKNRKSIYSFTKRLSDYNLFPGIVGLYECYKEGIGVPKNESEAAHYLELAKDRKYASRQCAIGLNYLNSRSVLYSPDKAFFWMEISSLNGYVKGMINLSSFYINGTGCNIDLNKAMEWAQKASNEGDLHGKRKVAAIYELLRINALKECANANDSISIVELADIYKRKGQFKQALNYYKQASDLGNPEAIYQYGKSLYKGKSCLKDVNQGIVYIQKAANMNHLGALEFMVNYLSSEEAKSSSENVELLKKYKHIYKEIKASTRKMSGRSNISN